MPSRCPSGPAEMRSDEAIVKIYIWDILRTHFELWSCVELSVEDDPADPPEGDQYEDKDFPK